MIEGKEMILYINTNKILSANLKDHPGTIKLTIDAHGKVSSYEDGVYPAEQRWEVGP
jgi:hypothetical protein